MTPGHENHARYRDLMAYLERIWIKRAHTGPMDERPSALVVANKGLEGNADFGTTRPVTMLATDRWARAEADLGRDVDPSTRRANLLVDGIDLVASRGRVVRIGEVRFRIDGETRPCRLMDDLVTGLQDALDADWGGGAYATPLDDGEIRVGDEVSWVVSDSPERAAGTVSGSGE